MKAKSKTKQELLMEVEELRQRLEEAEEMLRAIRSGEVDALVVSGPLEAVMESLPVGVAITDVHGGNIRANNAFEQVWGSPRPRAVSISDYAAYKAWWADTGKPVAPEEWASAQAVRKGEPVVQQVLEIQRFDGSHAFVINSGAPIFDAKGKIAGCAVAIQDITDLRKAQEALRQSEERLRRMVETSQIGIGFGDSTGHIFEANESFFRITGYSRKEILDGVIGWERLTAPEYAGIDRLVMEQVSATGVAGPYEKEYIRKSGSRIPILVSVTRLSTERDEHVAFIVDLTERKQMEEALRQSAQRERQQVTELATVLDAVPAAVWISHDPNCLHITGSRTADEVLQIPRGGESSLTADAATRPMHFKLVKDGLELVGEDLPVQRAAHGMTMEDFEFTLMFEDGTMRHMLGNATPLRDEQGQLHGSVAAFIDITQRKQMEEALQKSKERFEILSETASQLLAISKPQEIVNDLCQKVMTYLDCHAFFNYLVDEEKGRLHLNAYTGIPEETGKEIEWLDYGAAVCGCAAQDACWIVAEDIPNTPDPITELVKSFGIKAYACHPLFSAGRVIGTLSFGTRSRTTFTEEDLSLMKTVADQVATAMERIRLVDALRKSRDELEIRVQERTKEVREQSRVLDSYFKFSITPFVILDKDFNFIRVNEAYAKACHRDVSEFLGHNHFEFYPSDAKAKFEQVVQTKEPYAATARPFTFPDHPEWGTTYWDWTLTPVLDATGEVEYLVFSLEDVTKRKRAQEAVEAERQRFNNVLEMLPAYLVLLTPDHHVPFANRFFRERFGESHGQRCFEYLFGRSEPCEICESYTVLKTRAPHNWEWTGPDGHNYDVSDFPFTDTDDSTLILEMGIDITERKRAEEALRAAHQYNRSLIEASVDPLITISADGKVMDVNRATEIVTGIGRQDLIGSDFSDYFTDPEKAREGYQQVFAEGMVRDYPLAIQHTSGKVTDVLYNATLYRNEAGEVQGIFAAARDITDRKRAEGALRESENRLRFLSSQLLSVQENERRRVARELHDGIGQMLTAIKFKVENLLQEKGKTRANVKSLEAVLPMIREGMEEARRIQMDLRPSVLDDLGVLAALSWLCRNFEATYSHIHIEKQTHVQEEEVPLLLKTVIYRVSQEALNNVAKHSKADLVRLSLGKLGDRIELSTEDNGKGFDLEEILSQDRDKRGFGLNSMRERAELSGGAFAIESIKGKGTTIRATWPI
jgi:PAS domain S-box-containing protein